MPDRFSARRLVVVAAVAGSVITAGTLGFRWSLDEGWLAAFYRSVATVSLTGMDSVPRTTDAKAVSIALIVAGVSIFAFVASVVVEGIARGVQTGALAARRRRRVIARLQDHYIICGFGRVGRRVAEEFREAGVDYVVLDFSAEAIEAAQERGELLVKGRGTDDADLQAAGLARARGLVASVDSDADNLYITLSARSQRPDLLIVARASDEDAGKKLRLAGADRVVQPYSTAGREMAKLVLKPQVAAFLDVVQTPGGSEIRFEEIEIKESCPEAGHSIGDIGVRTRTGAVIVALRKADGSFYASPAPSAVLELGDVLIAVGTPDEVRAVEELFAPQEALAR
jgi:voltage-gated potassium channel